MQRKKIWCSKENCELVCAFLPLFKHVLMQLSKLPINIACIHSNALWTLQKKTRCIFSNFQWELFKLHQILQMLSAKARMKSSHSKATPSDSPEPGQQLQLWPKHLETPTSPLMPSSAGNTPQRVICTETEPGLSKRPLFYSNFHSSKSSF